MNYTETLEYLYSALPMFQRVGKQAYKPDLNNITELCAYLGNPQQNFASVHLAGTNGKGSTSHMLAAVMQSNGYRTGLFTSPHLKDFRERIRIDGKMIPKSAVCAFIERNWQKIDGTRPSFFEMTVALAFSYFSEMGVDLAIIETGLGGRLDSTNIIKPLVSVITNIGYDHTSILGTELSQIAAEKAGIIKPRTPVIIGEYHPETSGIFDGTAAANSAPIRYASEEWKTRKWVPGLVSQQMTLENLEGRTSSFRLDLPGFYQEKNVKTVLTTLDTLSSLGYRTENAAQALGQVKKLTKLKGRWSVLGRHPLIICDTGHNAEGIREVMTQIRATPHTLLHIVFGVVNDKELQPILELLPQEALYYFCSADIPRALDPASLYEQAAVFSLNGSIWPSVIQALEAAKAAAGPDDLIFIGGSTFVVAEIIP